MSDNKIVNVSKELENILKNAGTIHRNLMIKEDSDILRVKSPDNTLMMTAKLPAKMPGNFVIYDIMEFLSVLSLVDNAVMDMSDADIVRVTDASGETSIAYQYADERMISGYADKDLVPDEVLVEFDLSGEKITAAARASATLKLPNLAFIGDGENITFTALDSKMEAGSRSNSFSTKIGTTDKTFKIVFESEHLKMMPGNYRIRIGKRKGVLIAVFANKDQPVVYVVAVNATSEFTV